MAVVNARPPHLGLSAKFLAVPLLAFGAALLFFLSAYRTGEVLLTSAFLRLASSEGTYVDTSRQIIYFGIGGNTPLGLQMTPECTSALLVLPLVVIGAVMVFLRPTIARRVYTSLAIASIGLILVNQLRLLVLVGLVRVIGPSAGYYWGHTLLGSVVSIFGGAIALVLFVWLATRRPATERATARNATPPAARPASPDEGERPSARTAAPRRTPSPRPPRTTPPAPAAGSGGRRRRVAGQRGPTRRTPAQHPEQPTETELTRPIFPPRPLRGGGHDESGPMSHHGDLPLDEPPGRHHRHPEPPPQLGRHRLDD